MPRHAYIERIVTYDVPTDLPLGAVVSMVHLSHPARFHWPFLSSVLLSAGHFQRHADFCFICVWLWGTAQNIMEEMNTFFWESCFICQKLTVILHVSFFQLTLILLLINWLLRDYWISKLLATLITFHSYPGQFRNRGIMQGNNIQIIVMKIEGWDAVWFCQASDSVDRQPSFDNNTAKLFS
jgi:hypothetical protein